MITFYTASGNHFSTDQPSAWPKDAMWVDMLNPSDQQVRDVEEFFKIALPHRDDMSDIQISSQLYTEDGSHIVITPVIAGAGKGDYEMGAIAFILSPHVLVTLRTTDPRAVLLFRDKFMQKPHEYGSPAKIVLGLFDVFVDRSADVLERIGDEADAISRQIFSGAEDKKDVRLERDSHMRHILKAIGRMGDLLGQLRNALAGSERAVIYLGNHAREILGERGTGHMNTIQHDVHALEQQADSLQQRMEFLLDATLGMISIEQNKVMQIFTVSAVTLMPPTLLAGIWGMNFHNMPELALPHGYLLALFSILASTLVPLLYFRHKGWV